MRLARISTHAAPEPPTTAPIPFEPARLSALVFALVTICTLVESNDLISPSTVARPDLRAPRSALAMPAAAPLATASDSWLSSPTCLLRRRAICSCSSTPPSSPASCRMPLATLSARAASSDGLSRIASKVAKSSVACAAPGPFVIRLPASNAALQICGMLSPRARTSTVSPRSGTLELVSCSSSSSVASPSVEHGRSGAGSTGAARFAAVI